MSSDKVPVDFVQTCCRQMASAQQLESQTLPSTRPRWRAYWRETVPSRRLTAPLILISTTCGMLDATTYTDYKTFASNQTGNTLVMTLLACGLPTESSLALTLASLLSFLLFAFLAGAVARIVGPRRRFWLAISLAVQTVLFVIPSALLSSSALLAQGSHDWVLIGLLAAGSGVQVAMARGSSNPELPSAMLTSPFVDLLTDPHLFVPLRHAHSRARNLRTLYIFSLVGGSFLGAGLIKARSSEVVWWLVVALRLVCLSWVVALEGEKLAEAETHAS